MVTWSCYFLCLLPQCVGVCVNDVNGIRGLMCLKNAIFSIYIYTHLCLKSLSCFSAWFFPFIDSLAVQTQVVALGQHLGSRRRPGWFFSDNSCLSLLQVNLKAPIPFMKSTSSFSLCKTLSAWENDPESRFVLELKRSESHLLLKWFLLPSSLHAPATSSLQEPELPWSWDVLIQRAGMLQNLL